MKITHWSEIAVFDLNYWLDSKFILDSKASLLNPITRIKEYIHSKTNYICITSMQ